MQLHTVKEACGVLKISRTQLFRFSRIGMIRFIRFGRRSVRILDTELERFVRERQEAL